MGCPAETALERLGEGWVPIIEAEEKYGWLGATSSNVEPMTAGEQRVMEKFYFSRLWKRTAVTPTEKALASI